MGMLEQHSLPLACDTHAGPRTLQGRACFMVVSHLPETGRGKTGTLSSSWQDSHLQNSYKATSSRASRELAACVRV